ncbi:GerMN domain-containing protein [Egicoccus sp. AB-alg6-2]|uniref:GerMN domain-containing protein n=1 Tax=Egicoccus sp. AB-alg6-2 TaxID=3242692 RepID=UPI00359D832F
MPDISDLLDRAACGADGPAPIDTIVRRGRRRRSAARVATVGAPLAVAAVVAGMVLAGDGPSGLIIDPPPPVAESPDPAPTPSVDSTESAEPPPGERGEPPEAADASGWVEPSGMAADVLVIEADSGTSAVTRLAADGSLEEFELEAGVPNAAGLVPDGDGGVAWQPDSESMDAAPVLHRDAGGETTTLAAAEGPGEIQLVGWDLGLVRPLVTERSGSGFQDTTADLLAVPFDGGDAEVVREGVGAWEMGVSHAAVLETAIYAQYVEAMHNIVIDPPDGAPVVVFEGGELNGEYPRGVGFVESTGQAVALVERGPVFGETPSVRLLIIDPAVAEVVDELEVPIALGLADGAMEELLPQAGDLSVRGDHVLVNRRADGAWLPPVVLDVGSGTWSLLEHRDGGLVTGRAFLAPAAGADARQEFAACYTEDQSLVNAAPGGESLWKTSFVYLPCTDWDEPQDVHRLSAQVALTGDLVDDLTAALEVLLEEAPTPEQAERGYHSPVDGRGVRLRSAAVDDTGRAVVDVSFADGVDGLNSAHNSLVWHRMLFGTVFQFADVTSLELRLDGSCDAYAEFFQGDGCQTVGVAKAAPWNARG